MTIYQNYDERLPKRVKQPQDHSCNEMDAKSNKTKSGQF